MGRKKNKTTNYSEVLPILELKYSDPLFDVKLHPSKPIIISSLATGYVTCHKYDPKQLTSFMQSVKRKGEKYTESAGETATGATSVNTNNVLCKVFTVDPRGNDSSNATSFLTLMWKTRRHKGSVRSMCVDENGDYVYTIGSDNILKKANTMDGKVVKKINLLTLLSDDHSKDESTVLKITKLVKSAKQPLLILGDESGNVYVLSSKDLSLQNTIHNIHNGDAINDLIPFAKRSVYKYISLGQTTLAYWDSRKSKDKDGESKITVSDDQEDEILCGTFVNPENGEVLVCGMGEGILTIWKPNKNQLQDQLSRIKICKNQSIDSVVPTLQDDNCVWCGCSDGNVYKVNIKTSKIEEIRKHSDFDEVCFLDLDYDYRLLSGGMDSIKLWDNDNAVVNEDISDTDTDNNGELNHSSNASNFDDVSDPDSDSDSDSNSDSDSDSNFNENKSDAGQNKNARLLSKEELLAELSKSDSEEENKEHISNKRRHMDNKHQNSLTKKPKKKDMQSRSKPDHGITKFDGL